MARCPGCEHAVLGHEPISPEVEGYAPKPGDLAVCSFCVALLVYDAGGELARLSAEAKAALDPEVRHALDLARVCLLETRRRGLA